MRRKARDKRRTSEEKDSTGRRAFYHTSYVLSAWDSLQLGTQEQVEPKGATFFHTHFGLELTELPGQPAPPAQAPCPHPNLPCYCLPSWWPEVPLGRRAFCRFAGCSDKAKWDNPRMPGPPLAIFSQPALGQQCRKATAGLKTNRENRTSWERTLVNQQNRLLPLNIQEIARGSLSLVLKLVCRDFPYVCSPQSRGKGSGGILANLDQEPNLSAREPSMIIKRFPKAYIAMPTKCCIPKNQWSLPLQISAF